MKRRLQLFGTLVRDIRIKRGMTQSALAYTTNMNRTCISAIENGRRNISLEVLYCLAVALDVEGHVLLGSRGYGELPSDL